MGLKQAQNVFVIYFVTAKHVFQRLDGDFYDRVLVRLNTRSGGFENEMIDFSILPILTHEDETVDIAAVLLYPDQNHFDYLWFQDDYFSDDAILKEKGIREGSNVFFPGLFAKAPGVERNHPVLRFGKISLLTSEKTEINKAGDPKRLAHVYFVECQSLGAFSGAPVFFERDRIMKDKIFYTPEVYIGGVMKGHYNDVLETPAGVWRELNASLAVVTPCYQLKEILMTDKAKEQRAKLPDPYSIPDENIPYGLERAKL